MIFFSFFYVVSCFWYTVSCSPSWLPTHCAAELILSSQCSPSVEQMLGLQTWATTPSSKALFVSNKETKALILRNFTKIPSKQVRHESNAIWSFHSYLSTCTLTVKWTCHSVWGEGRPTSPDGNHQEVSLNSYKLWPRNSGPGPILSLVAKTFWLQNSR